MRTREVIYQAYSAFNARDMDRTLALMSESVSWPKASEGGRVVGKRDIRDYWTRQWASFDPHVDVLEVIDRPSGKTEVKVHQLVKNLNGEVLSDTELWHVYLLEDGLIERMDMLEADGITDGQSTAFADHGP